MPASGQSAKVSVMLAIEKELFLMAVVRVHKNDNYTVMSNYHFKERGLSLKAKGLLSLMLSLPNTWDYSIAGLVKLSKDGKDSVMSALGELEKYGYLKRVRQKDSKGKFSGIEYNIYEAPQANIPIADNPISDKPTADNENAEKPLQLNTKELNTKEVNTKGLNTNNDIYREALDNIKDIELRSLYEEYIEMREEMQAPVSKRGLDMLINRNERLSNLDIELQKALLEAAILNNWKNVYLPNEQDIQNNNTLANLKRFYNS